MSDCPNLSRCPFFLNQLASMPTMAEVMKKRHCHDSFKTCARWMVSNGRGKDAVPADLFPNQMDRATKILAAA